MDSFVRHTAESDFRKARKRETLQKIFNLLNPQSQRLLSLREVRDVLHPRIETYRGIQAVEVDKIVGSEGRYADFNKGFLPKHEHLKRRWTRVDQALLTDVILPPIRLFEIGGVYFVRDGNHRVSVARQQGVMNIDAEVVSLDSEIQLAPDVTSEGLTEAVVEYEKAQFYRRTRFDRIFPDYDLRFTATGRYDEIEEHIHGHKYYINQNYQEEIPFEAAMRSWFHHVFTPVIATISERNLLVRFPGRTEADLYVWMVKHWDELKHRYGPDFSLEKAAEDLNNRFGRSLWQQLVDTADRWRKGRERKRRIARGEILDDAED